MTNSSGDMFRSIKINECVNNSYIWHRHPYDHKKKLNDDYDLKKNVDRMSQTLLLLSSIWHHRSINDDLIWIVVEWYDCRHSGANRHTFYWNFSKFKPIYYTDFLQLYKWWWICNNSNNIILTTQRIQDGLNLSEKKKLSSVFG